MMQTNIKMGYNSESKNERDYIIGGPCRPFVGLSIARCPHFEILPGKNPHGLNFPFHILCTRCIVVQTNIKLSYNSDSIHERDYTLNGLCRPFVGLSIACYPHFEILPGNKSAWFEFPVPCYKSTRCIMVRTNIKLVYNSGSKNKRDYTLDGPCGPFVGLSIACCPHFEILPGNKSAWFEFSVPCFIHTLYNGATEYQNGL